MAILSQSVAVSGTESSAPEQTQVLLTSKKQEIATICPQAYKLYDSHSLSSHRNHRTGRRDNSLSQIYNR